MIADRFFKTMEAIKKIINVLVIYKIYIIYKSASQ